MGQCPTDARSGQYLTASPRLRQGYFRQAAALNSLGRLEDALVAYVLWAALEPTAALAELHLVRPAPPPSPSRPRPSPVLAPVPAPTLPRPERWSPPSAR